jgi:hypothetical protein
MNEKQVSMIKKQVSINKKKIILAFTKLKFVSQ